MTLDKTADEADLKPQRKSRTRNNQRIKIQRKFTFISNDCSDNLETADGRL